MPTCPHAGQCPMFPLLEMHARHELKSLYCDGKFERCERTKRSRDRRIVPMNLLPDGKMLGASTERSAEPSPTRR